MSLMLDALPYCDEPPSDTERQMVQTLIEEEMRCMGKTAHDYLERIEDVNGDMARTGQPGRADFDVGPPPSPLRAIDTARYTDISDVERAKVALEYEMGRHLEAQLRLKYSALCHRAHNEARASMLRRAEEELRVLLGDSTMINRDRKSMQGGAVKADLERMRTAFHGLLGKNARLEAAMEAVIMEAGT